MLVNRKLTSNLNSNYLCDPQQKKFSAWVEPNENENENKECLSAKNIVNTERHVPVVFYWLSIGTETEFN